MKWRKLNNIIHRDLGYLCFGLTLIYVISGVAVNHIQDWNPTYSIERSTTVVDLGSLDTTDNNILTTYILKQLDEGGTLKNYYRLDRETLKIFVENNNLTLHIPSQTVFEEKSKKRALLYHANFLHLNHAKKMWTWFADLYAIALGLLAITGLFVLKGRKGITGRGAWLTGLGCVVPLFFLWLYG